MSVAVLADVHGNLPALRAVLAEIDTLGVDTIVAAATSHHVRCPSPTAPCRRCGLWERNAGRA